jgi:fructokinase
MQVLVTGTLGLAYPTTAAAMHDAVGVAKAAGTTVLLDINWRPVFWDQPEKALDVIRPYVKMADIIKMTNEEVQWMFGIPAAEALQEPERVRSLRPSLRGRSHAVHRAATCVNTQYACTHLGVLATQQLGVRSAIKATSLQAHK